MVAVVLGALMFWACVFAVYFTAQGISPIEFFAGVCAGVNPATELELVGAAVYRDRANWNDSTARIRVEFFTRGATATGDKVGGWEELDPGNADASGNAQRGTLCARPLAT